MKLSNDQTVKAFKKRKIIIQGNVYDCLEAAAKALGKSRNTVDYRLSKGWSPEQAVGLTPPPSFAPETPEVPIQIEGNNFKTIKDAVKYYQRAYTHVIESLKKGRSIEQSLGLAVNENTLQLKNSKLVKQWHPFKNGDNSRNLGMGCPYYASQKPTEKRNFAFVYPELLKEWDYELNKGINPSELTPFYI